MVRPKFQHDCESCKFLGTINGMDGYRCNDSYLLRYSSEGGDYFSGEDFGDAFRTNLKNTTSFIGFDPQQTEDELDRRTLIHVLGWAVSSTMRKGD